MGGLGGDAGFYACRTPRSTAPGRPGACSPHLALRRQAFSRDGIAADRMVLNQNCTQGPRAPLPERQDGYDGR